MVDLQRLERDLRVRLAALERKVRTNQSSVLTSLGGVTAIEVEITGGSTTDTITGSAAATTTLQPGTYLLYGVAGATT